MNSQSATGIAGAGALFATVENNFVAPHKAVNRRHPMGLGKDMKDRIGIFGELWAFMRVRKKWWLGPIMIFLLLLGVLIVFTEGSALAPFIYALF